MSLNKRVAEMSHNEPRYQMMRAALALLDKPLVELNEQELKQVKQQAYRELIIEQKALSSSEATALIIPQTMVDNAVQDIIARYDDEDIFWKTLADNQLTREQLHQAVERDLRVQAVIERISARGWKSDDTDGEIFYNLHIERFHVPEKRTLRHILVTINDDYQDSSRQQVLKKINQIRQRVVAKPSRFEEQAQKHSECPTALHGGLLGAVGKGLLYPELEQAAFNLSVGKVSSPIETELGLHIVYCEAIVEGRTVSYYEVKNKLKEKLQQRLDRIWLRQWLKGE